MFMPLDEIGKWNQRSNASHRLSAENAPMFRFLFERSPDATWLFDARTGVFTDCNQAAIDLMRCGTRERILQARPAELSPLLQPDGRSSEEKAAELVSLAEKNGSVRFEWVARRFDGTEVPLEVVATVLPLPDQTIHVIISRDITERKKAEQEILKLNATLERRVLERMAELSASEARLRTIVEHAPEAIVVFDAKTDRFVMVNENA